MYNKFLQFGAGIGGFVQIFNTFDSVTSTLKQVATDLAAMDDVYSDVMKTTNLTREEVDELNESFKKLDTRTSKTFLSRFCLSKNAKISNRYLQITDFQRLSDFCGERGIRTPG